MPPLANLKSELTLDPLGRGYAGMSNAAAASDLNALSRSRARTSVLAQEIFDAIVPAEYSLLTATQRDVVSSVLSLGPVVQRTPATQAALLAVFGPATTTRSNLLALATEPCSRAAELGFGAADPALVGAARES